jgi:hypothetical protein
MNRVLIHLDLAILPYSVSVQWKRRQKNNVSIDTCSSSTGGRRRERRNKDMKRTAGVEGGR